MEGRVKPLAGSHQQRNWLSFWQSRQQQVLRPPHETTITTRGIHASAPADALA
jgi:hypothetical protein